LNIPATTAKSTIERIQPYLLEGLKSRWWNDRKRPKPLDDEEYGYIALLADSSSTEINRPRGRFEEVMCYWDGKNKI